MCSIHIKEVADDPKIKNEVTVTLEIRDGIGIERYSAERSGVWGSSATISQSDSLLPYDMTITWTTKSSRKRSSLWMRMVGGPVTTTPDRSYENRIVSIEAGSTTFDSTQTDKSKMPYMNVGKWDNNGDPPVRASKSYDHRDNTDLHIRTGRWTDIGIVRQLPIKGLLGVGTLSVCQKKTARNKDSENWMTYNNQ